jgi:hypothetical protein
VTGSSSAESIACTASAYSVVDRAARTRGIAWISAASQSISL